MYDFRAELGKVYNLRMDIRANLDISTDATVYIDGVEYLEMSHTEYPDGKWKPPEMWGKGKIPIYVSHPYGGDFGERYGVGQIKNLKLTFNPYVFEVMKPGPWFTIPAASTGLGGFDMLKDYALSFDFKMLEWPTTEQNLISVGEFPAFASNLCVREKHKKKHFRKNFQITMSIDHSI